MRFFHTLSLGLAALAAGTNALAVPNVDIDLESDLDVSTIDKRFRLGGGSKYLGKTLGDIIFGQAKEEVKQPAELTPEQKKQLEDVFKTIREKVTIGGVLKAPALRERDPAKTKPKKDDKTKDPKDDKKKQEDEAKKKKEEDDKKKKEEEEKKKKEAEAKPVDSALYTALAKHVPGGKPTTGTRYKFELKNPLRNPPVYDSNPEIAKAQKALNAYHFEFVAGAFTEKKTPAKGKTPAKWERDFEGTFFDLRVLADLKTDTLPVVLKADKLNAPKEVKYLGTTKVADAKLKTNAKDYIKNNPKYVAATVNCKTFVDDMAKAAS